MTKFVLHKKQSLAYATKATEVLYGGAAGGGKSHLMRIRALTFCLECPGAQVYLFRRIREDLVKNHMEGPSGFRILLDPYVKAKQATIVEDEIRFKNGSKIYLCHCKDEKDRFKYLGAEIHLLLIDELTHFTETIYRFLRNRVRMIGIKKDGFPKIIVSSNPGGPGHTWVKHAFIDSQEPYKIVKQPPEEGGMLRQFIPALLEDNPSMQEFDPDYEDRLAGLGSDALVKAYRYGDWNIIEGAFFTEFDSRRHIIAPFEIPEEWPRIRAMDWGSAAPFSVGWYAVVGDDTRVRLGKPHSEGPEATLVLPRGCLVKYREWYGASGPNKGLKLTAEKVADGIKEREADDPKIARAVLDPSAFAVDGGPSIAEAMYSRGVAFSKADNRRISRRGALSGWNQLRQRLVGDEEGRPMIAFFETCKDTIRTLPAMQHDELNPEDVDTHGEDHAADETRYACMARPYVRKKPKPDKAWEFKPPTYNEAALRAERNVKRNQVRERI